MTTSKETNSRVRNWLQQHNLTANSTLREFGEFVGVCVDRGMIRPKPIFNTVFVETCRDSFLKNNPNNWKERIEVYNELPTARELVISANIRPDTTIREIGHLLGRGLDLGVHRPFLLDCIWEIGLDTILRNRNAKKKLAGYRERFT
jgi:hypothetical protein